MITKRLRENRDMRELPHIQPSAEFFREDFPLGSDADELPADYLAALRSDAGSYSGPGCESHLWIG